MYFVAVVAHIRTKQYKQHIYIHIYVCVSECVYTHKYIDKEKVRRVTVLSIFAFYSNYGSSVNIYQGYIIPV